MLTNWQKGFNLTQSGLNDGCSHVYLLPIPPSVYWDRYLINAKNRSHNAMHTHTAGQIERRVEILTLKPLKAFCTTERSFNLSLFGKFVRSSFIEFLFFVFSPISILILCVRIYCYSWWYGNLTYFRCACMWTFPWFHAHSLPISIHFSQFPVPCSSLLISILNFVLPTFYQTSSQWCIPFIYCRIYR